MDHCAPTTALALDEFESRYKGFHAERAPRENVRFDELVCRARRHSKAISRRPPMDFQRPVAMLIEACAE